MSAPPCTKVVPRLQSLGSASPAGLSHQTSLGGEHERQSGATMAEAAEITPATPVMKVQADSSRRSHRCQGDAGRQDRSRVRGPCCRVNAGSPRGGYERNAKQHFVAEEQRPGPTRRLAAEFVFEQQELQQLM